MGKGKIYMVDRGPSLKNTITLMLSDDYRDRLYAELLQVAMRSVKLSAWMDKLQKGEATTPVPYEVLIELHETMDRYATLLNVCVEKTDDGKRDARERKYLGHVAINSLVDTMPLMANTSSCSDHLRAEFHQLRIRRDGLRNMLAEYESGHDFALPAPAALLETQIEYMTNYLRVLITRAHIEGVDLGDDYAAKEKVDINLDD